MTKQINFFKELTDLQTKAYCPYSKFRVAAIIETDAGIFKGVNVENCSYGLTCCAERTAMFTAVVNGAKTVSALHLITDCPAGAINMCGACRQVMSEFMVQNGPVYVYAHDGSYTEHNFETLFPRLLLGRLLLEDLKK